ncbi:solute carrier family 43 member 3-like isoform X1 [Centruroides sculpturatus]|uniref:solute carrier family 43 member 3-like isoform X1 n=1 Tax=Centruroides sculpturatus TaxID=218467 RepID=UPI000C6E9588|nr:solute carrier family 43 member 3-like isoform X1 [Centruroides sculpturatus]
MKPEEYSKSRKFLIMFVGFVETLLFSGVLFGWADLVYLMKLEGVFSSRCREEYLTTVNGTRICQEQDNLFDLAFTLVTFSKGSASILIGLLLDHFGLRVSRLLANVQVTTGWFLIGYSAKSNPYLLFPGCLLLGLGGSQIRMNNFLIANLFPSQKSSVISLYNGAFCASAAIFLIAKCMYPYGFDMKTSCVFLAGLSGLMLIPTMFLLPVNTIETSDDDSPDIFDSSMIVSEKSSSIHKNESADSIDNTAENNLEKSAITTTKTKDYGSTSENKSYVIKPDSHNLQQSFLSLDYLLHLIWSCVLGLGLAVYGGTFDHWVESITDDVVTVSNLIEWFGFCHIPMLLIAPLAGMWLDYGLNAAKNEDDPVKRIKMARSTVFWCLFLTTVVQLIQIICMFFNSVHIVYASLFIFIFNRPLVNALSVVYLRICFPSKQFNCLLGILGTTAAIFSLVQFPIFVWFGSDAFAANLLVVILIALCFSSPFNLLLKKT